MVSQNWCNPLPLKPPFFLCLSNMPGVYWLFPIWLFLIFSLWKISHFGFSLAWRNSCYPWVVGLLLIIIDLFLCLYPFHYFVIFNSKWQRKISITFSASLTYGWLAAVSPCLSPLQTSPQLQWKHCCSDWLKMCSETSLPGTALEAARNDQKPPSVQRVQTVLLLNFK